MWAKTAYIILSPSGWETRKVRAIFVSALLAMTVTPAVGRPAAKAKLDFFAAYPCSDAVGHAAKCEPVDSKGVGHESHDCVDGLRARVQCVQPIILPTQPPPGTKGVRAEPRRITVGVPPDTHLPEPPLVYRDTASSITFHVDGDRRQVSAVSSSGELLWRHDPLKDSGTDPYRVAIPRIDGIGPASEPFLKCCSKGKSRKYVGVSYDSSQFGMIDVSSGEFIFLGQN